MFTGIPADLSTCLHCLHHFVVGIFGSLTLRALFFTTKADCFQKGRGVDPPEGPPNFMYCHTLHYVISNAAHKMRFISTLIF